MVIYCEVVIGVYPAIINHGIILNIDSIKFLIGFCSQEMWSISIIFSVQEKKTTATLVEYIRTEWIWLKVGILYCVSWLDNRSNLLQFYIKNTLFARRLSLFSACFFFNFASIIVVPKTVFFISTSVEHNQMLFKCRKRMKKKYNRIGVVASN